MISADKSLLTALKRYLLANQVSKKHAENLRYKLGMLEHWTGYPLSFERLTVEHLNEFLVALESAGRAPSTVNGYRSAILAVWRYTTGGPESHEGKVRRLSEPHREVQGWRKHEVKQLLRIAKTYRGHLPNGVKRKDFWMTAIHCGYATGLRYSDLAKLRVKKIRKDRTCDVIAHKKVKRVTVRFSKKAMKCIKRHGQKRVLPCPYTQKWFCDHFSRLVERAGVRGGTFKWLRRTAGSYADRNGKGPELLGNTRAVFDKSYRVSEIVRAKIPQPPKL